MNQTYIFESIKNREYENEEAIIVLPDIYCQTDYSKKTVEKFADAFKRPVFMLDYFYTLTEKANNFSENDRDVVHGLIKQLLGDAFLRFFQESVQEIQAAYPHISTFTIVGFCFGGRLAYIAGGEKSVSRIVSFYGAGPHTPNYVAEKTPVEYLISQKANTDIKVFSFYGLRDPSISEADRVKTKDMFSSAHISYRTFEYDTGHAYFQEGRQMYDASASTASWQDLKEIFNG